jgi:hypothetical protein
MAFEIIIGDNLIGGVKYMHGKITRKLCSYLYLKLAKVSLFSFYVLSFLFSKTEEQVG